MAWTENPPPVVVPAFDTTDALDVIDDLRRRVMAGEVVAFCLVGIDAQDVARVWTSSTRPVSRLRMMGAIANLEHCYHAGVF
jgi:hypothetical protein